MKKKGNSKRIFSIVATLIMLLSLIVPGIAHAELNKKTHQSLNDSNVLLENKVSSGLLETFKKEDKVTFLIKFKENTDTEKVAAQAKQDAGDANLSAKKSVLMQRSAVVSELKMTSFESQQNVKQYLNLQVKAGNAKDITSYYIVNGMAVTATKEVAEKVATFAEVEKILPNETRQLYTTKTQNAVTPKSEIANVEWNVDRVNAPKVWDMGIDGSGTVVASIDSGVQWNHPALKEKYRGYNAATGEVNHDFNWFDATVGRTAQTTPHDDEGHGTHVTGTMVGGEPDGSNQIGVAPGAKWIAVKAFSEDGGYDSDLLAAAQWILAPTDANGNTRVDLAPDVVNNSWGGGAGLDEWYRDVVKNWRAAEIFPEFSAGNTDIYNPGGPGSVASPGNYPESFATGATDINNTVGDFSLRGPSPYEEIKPDISAPGVNIRSSVPGSGYEGGWNGTSMAGPAVSAVAAMLRQVNANLTVDEMEQILLETATPLTDSEYPKSPNHGYGYGLVDAYEAVYSIINGLGKLEGQVGKQGEDNEAPTFTNTTPVATYMGMDLDLTIQVSDNISVASVVLNYQGTNGEWIAVDATQKSGDYKSGEYGVTIPGEEISGDSFTYKWTINDFGNNEVISENYTAEVKPAITVGYFENFEETPIGWTSFGAMDSWEWGVPTSGPGSAVSGEKVYATNLEGLYDSKMNATLQMPPVDLPEGNVYLQFKHWYHFEEPWATAGVFDYGHIVISTDKREWTKLVKIQDRSTSWLDAEVDLSAYSGQRVYIGFNAISDGAFDRDGWYIDDVSLVDTSQMRKVSKGVNQDDKGRTENPEISGLDSFKKPNHKNPDVIKEKEKDLFKEAIDLTKIKPALPATPDEGDFNPLVLPIGAQVSVLETGRSVYSNLADGKYSLMHGAGTFTAKAEAYGYQSTEQTVTIEADTSTQANFILEETPKATVSGTITDKSTGEGIEGAKLLLLEDANITPVVTDVNGNYSITAYEGDYTLVVFTRGYSGQRTTISIGNDTAVNIELEPYYTYPGGEIGYDDGTVENAQAFYEAGNAWGVKMTLPAGKESAVVTDGVFRFYDKDWPKPGGTAFKVEVWDATGVDGAPGKKLAGPFNAQAKRDGTWTVVDLAEYNIVVNSDFYMVYVQTQSITNAPGVATDEDGLNAGRSYEFASGSWSPSPEEEGNYMIRARVNYDVLAPVITSPTQGFITNEKNGVIEGVASPTTAIELMNNGEKVGSVVVGDDGKFTIPTKFVEGANEMIAVSKLGGKVTGESAPVTVTLDTINPELTIDNPKNGDKTNRETITVEGTVSDVNLKSVQVNGFEAAIVGGKYSKRILLDNGVSEITVVATDSANNQVTRTVTVTAQYNAPTIENLTPGKDLHLVTGKSVKIQFDSEPGHKASFVIHMPLTDVDYHMANATELPIVETTPGHYVGYWTVPLGTVAKGAVIEVKVVDGFKNEARQEAKGKLFINSKE
ncbi:S8 family serine peptidase [Sporosarcina sp. NPDC096371]|uniref:S8 family serine peptidase n=1 Tax=Sporosarcina sp. NPDC096371 TaxID=3364530 RepID=UPI003801D670